MKNRIEGNADSVESVAKGDVFQNIKGIYKTVIKCMIPMVILLGIFVVMLIVANAKIGELEAKLKAALQETHHVEITDVHIEEKLTEIGELATMSFEYTNQATIEDVRQVFGLDILGTKHSIDIIYSGVIKVGYDISEVGYEVDESRKVIIFSIPDPQVLDNYIILDNVQCTDKNNIFNPIGSDEIIEYFSDLQDRELDIAEKNGIYEKAEMQLESIIENYFGIFNEYKVIFTSD